MMTLRGILLISLSLLSCGDESMVEEKPSREIITYVCHNPESIWHLSECNEQCLVRDYDNNAYCHGLVAEQCERPSTDFVRRACGLYHYQGTTER